MRMAQARKIKVYHDVVFSLQSARSDKWWRLIVPVMSKGKILLLRRLLSNIVPCRSARPAVEGPKFVIGERAAHVSFTYLTPIAVGVLRKVLEDYMVIFQEIAEKHREESAKKEEAALAEGRTVLFPAMGDRHPLVDELHEFLGHVQHTPCIDLQDPASKEEASHILFQLGEICRSHSFGEDHDHANANP